MQERRGSSQLNITSIGAGTCKEGRSQRTCPLSAAGIAHVPLGEDAISGVADEWCAVSVYTREMSVI